LFGCLVVWLFGCMVDTVTGWHNEALCKYFYHNTARSKRRKKAID